MALGIAGSNLQVIAHVFPNPRYVGIFPVAVMVPEATPPESKAMAVKILGTKKVSASAAIYPGSRNHIMEIPVRTRTIASASDTATPADKSYLGRRRKANRFSLNNSRRKD